MLEWSIVCLGPNVKQTLERRGIVQSLHLKRTNFSRQMFSLRAPTQPAKPSVNVIPPTTSTNQTGSKPCSRVTWVKSIRMPFKQERPIKHHYQYPKLTGYWWCANVYLPFRSMPKTQSQWRLPLPAAEYEEIKTSNQIKPRDCCNKCHDMDLNLEKLDVLVMMTGWISGVSQLRIAYFLLPK